MFLSTVREIVVFILCVHVCDGVRKGWDGKKPCHSQPSYHIITSGNRFLGYLAGIDEQKVERDTAGILT